MVFPVQKVKEEVLPKEAATKKHRFGSEEGAAFYLKAKACFYEHQCYRILDTAVRDNTTIYTFCNLWRIEKKGERFTFFKYSLYDKEWVKIKYTQFPDLVIAPFNYNPASQLLSAAGREILRYLSRIGEVPDPEKMRVSLRLLIEVVVNYYAKFVNEKGGNKVLVKTLWVELIDRAVYRQYCLVKENPSRSFFCAYYKCYQNRKGLTKVIEEHPNLVPLLPLIQVRYWGKDDLFAGTTWLIEKNQTQALIRKRSSMKGLHSKAAFRWLMQAKRPLIREVVRYFNADFIENFAVSQVEIPKKVLRYAMIKSMPVSTAYVRLIRLLAEECKRLKKELKEWRACQDLAEQFYDLAHWLEQAGAEAGFPDKFSTWNSLRRRHDAWIETFQNKARNHYSWASPLGEFEMDGFRVRPLTSSEALYEEGQKMNHCIASYEGSCLRGEYLAFALCDQKTEQDFTLGFCMDARRWKLDQIRSYCNSAASNEARVVGARVLRVLNKLLVKSLD